MLVVVGANGLTGVELVREALRRQIPVRAVVRDDRDAALLDAVIDVAHISYADPDEYDQLPPALAGATDVISCVDPRTAGPGRPIYSEESSVNVVRAASEAGARAVIHMTVMGAFRWSPNSMNRKAFHLDRGVRAEDAPWTLFRVSSYIDEVIHAHVRPPDGGRAHKIRRSSRYSPTSRRDAARMALDYLDKAHAGRQVCVGGPKVYEGDELEALLSRWRNPGEGRTQYRPLPHGDVSVMPDSTRVTVGYIPPDCLEDYLDPANEPPPAEEPDPVYARIDPGPHAADAGKDYKVLQPLGGVLRRVVHDQLVGDLVRLGISVEGITLDFSRARIRKNGRSAKAHEGEFTELVGVRVVDAETDMILHKGGVDFVRDVLAEEFHCWWAGSGIPESIWLEMDMGVQRRMAADAHFAEDPLAVEFRTKNPAL